jgi:tetratricopeptide (TPR) repeat protein
MSPRARVFAVVAIACVAAVAGVVGVTLLQTRGEHTGTVARKGAPPLQLPATGELARAVALYGKGERAAAGEIFARGQSLAAEIGAAFASWPNGSLDRMKELVASHQTSALAELHLGLAYLWAGRNADAVAAIRKAATLGADSPVGIQALDDLHPDVAPGQPPIVAASARGALLRGIELWNGGRPVSARRALSQAVAASPHDPVVLVAAAVATFSPAQPLRPFPLLGPLTAQYPHAAVVRLHLGLLLIWTRQVAKGEKQLRQAIAEQPRSVYAAAAKRLLDALPRGGTK